MFVRYVGLSAALALAANAVLIPPGVALSQEHAEEHEKDLETYQNGAAIPLRCYGCPFSKVEGEGMAWTTEEVDNSLVYQFGLGSHHDKLTLSGVQLYPPSFNEPEPIYVAQVPADVESVEEYLAANPDRKALRVTGMEFAFNGAETITEAGNELLVMHLRIFGLADMPVPPQVLRIFLIKDPQGRLSLAQVTKLNNPFDIQAEEMEQCKNWPMLCKWRKIFADKFAGLSAGKPKKPGCHKARPTGDRIDTRPHHHPFGKPHPDGHPHGRPRPHHGGHAHGWHHHHHSKLQRFMHMVTRVLVNIVVPILLGVAVGVATYTAGTLIGMTAAMIWIKILGARRGQYDAVPQDEEEGSDDKSKLGKEVYLDEEVPEELGEAPPVYEEVAEKEVVN